MVARFGLSWSTPGLVVWASGLAVLAACDAERMLLPKRVVYLVLIVTAACLLVAAGAEHAWGQLGWAVVTAVVAEGLFAVWAIGWPGSLGFGDVRLVGVIGLGVGWVAPLLVVVSVCAGLVVAVAVGLIGVVSGRLLWGSRLPLGAFLAGAAVVTVAAR